jgi:curved DNA-binding protein CbpA
MASPRPSRRRPSALGTMKDPWDDLDLGGRTLYQVLHVVPATGDPELTDALVKAAYRALAPRMHPDTSGIENPEILLIIRAHEILMNREQRAAYDRTLAAGRPVVDQTIRPGPPSEAPQGRPGFGPPLRQQPPPPPPPPPRMPRDAPAGPAWEPVTGERRKPRLNRMAVGALVLALISGFTAPLSILLAVLARRQIRASGGRERGAKAASAAIWISIVWGAIAFVSVALA